MLSLHLVRYCFSCHPFLFLYFAPFSLSFRLPLERHIVWQTLVTCCLQSIAEDWNPGYWPFESLSFRKSRQRTNEWTNERGPLARRMDCPEFVRSSSHSSVGIIELFVSIYLFFWPVADSTVPVGLCLLIEKGLSVVSNPFNIAGNLTTFFKTNRGKRIPRANTNDTGCAVILKNFLLRVSVQENLYIFSWHIQNGIKSESAEYSVERERRTRAGWLREK